LVSLPLPPLIVSAPFAAEPWFKVSSPFPPDSVSAPVSLEPSLRTSLPAPPVSESAPSLPVIVSAPSLPVSALSLPFPVRASAPLPVMAFSTSARTLSDSVASPSSLLSSERSTVTGAVRAE
jgi:hypothetical protein